MMVNKRTALFCLWTIGTTAWCNAQLSIPMTKTQSSASGRKGAAKLVGDGTSIQDLIAQQKVGFTIDVQIGGQDVKLMVDTGSAVPWVGTVSCATCSFWKKPLYDPSKSSAALYNTSNNEYLKTHSYPLSYGESLSRIFSIPSLHRPALRRHW